jgi:hypothetical protein
MKTSPASYPGVLMALMLRDSQHQSAWDEAGTSPSHITFMIDNFAPYFLISKFLLD